MISDKFLSLGNEKKKFLNTFIWQQWIQVLDLTVLRYFLECHVSEWQKFDRQLFEFWEKDKLQKQYMLELYIVRITICSKTICPNLSIFEVQNVRHVKNPNNLFSIQ
jgi:hypothetical protein